MNPSDQRATKRAWTREQAAPMLKQTQAHCFRTHAAAANWALRYLMPGHPSWRVESWQFDFSPPHRPPAPTIFYLLRPNPAFPRYVTHVDYRARRFHA